MAVLSAIQRCRFGVRLWRGGLLSDAHGRIFLDPITYSMAYGEGVILQFEGSGERAVQAILLAKSGELRQSSNFMLEGATWTENSFLAHGLCC